MRSRNRYRATLSVEGVESRTLLAGNVVAAVVGGDLVVTGDNSANAFDIVPGSVADSFVVRGRSDGRGQLTKINGASEFVANGVTRDIKVQARGGNDVVQFVGGNVVPLATARNVSVDLGTGNDTARLLFTDVGGNLIVKGAAGNDRVELNQSHVRGSTNIDSAAGNDTVSLLQTQFGGSTTILLGSGNDTIRAGSLQGGQHGSNFDAALLLKLGGGNDRAEAYHSSFQQALSILGEGGSDRFVANQSTFQSTVVANGGPGGDTVDAQPNNGNAYSKRPTLSQFEIVVP